MDIVFVGGNLVSRKSKEHNVVARSSAKLEYRAMAQATCKLIWFKHLLDAKLSNGNYGGAMVVW